VYEFVSALVGGRVDILGIQVMRCWVSAVRSIAVCQVSEGGCRLLRCSASSMRLGCEGLELRQVLIE
jgi:hypothetical protein